MGETIAQASSFAIEQWIFLKFLLLNYCVAFASLAVQVKGLYGKKGITPIRETLQSIRQSHYSYSFLRFPSLFWFNTHDYLLQAVAWIGSGLAIVGLIGIGPLPLLFFLLWIGYLSFLTVGTEFLSFQWDILLVEVGFVAIFFSIQTPPPILLLVLLWMILFRLMFSSGLIKLFASTPEWRQLEAMRYHYETQPLPNKIAYYLHKMPLAWARLSVIGTLILETIIPFFIFGSSDFRFIAFLCFVGFQVLILLTGNYAFFNWLSIALCIPLLEDSRWEWLGIHFNQASDLPSFDLSLVLNGVGLILLFFNLVQVLSLFTDQPIFYRILQIVRPFYLVNSYGLFANMTTHRPEIIIEGSEDGKEWKPYEFKWKPDDLCKAPKQAAPHQPRLDWQMWFAALGHFYYHPWFFNFLIRLLEGSEPVLKLLKTNPFPERPPHFIRALLYDYRFSSCAKKRETGQWWTRTLLKVYMPTLALKSREKNLDQFE